MLYNTRTYAIETPAAIPEKAHSSNSIGPRTHRLASVAFAPEYIDQSYPNQVCFQIRYRTVFYPMHRQLKMYLKRCPAGERVQKSYWGGWMRIPVSAHNSEFFQPVFSDSNCALHFWSSYPSSKVAGFRSRCSSTHSDEPIMKNRHIQRRIFKRISQPNHF